jgi:DNA-binding transcriptional LysR family regulator
VLAVRKNHPATKLRGLQLIKALSSYPLISPKAFAGIEICEEHPALLKLGIPLSASFVYDSYDTACSVILSGLYWGLVPEMFAKKYALAVLNLPDFDAYTEISAVISKRRALPKAVQRWLKTITF